MPRYHGRDYYIAAITNHYAVLNKAILAIPLLVQKHASGCCFDAVNDAWISNSHAADILSQSYGAAPNTDLISLLNCPAGLGKIESYDRTMVKCIGEELLEVIPSSNPESDDCTPEVDASWTNLRQIVPVETFTVEQFSGEIRQPLETPLCIDELALAIRDLPQIETLLSRLQEVAVDDPLLKPDGSKWKEEEFFNVDDRCIGEEPMQRDIILAKEQFCKYSFKECEEHCLEPLLSPHIPIKGRNIHLEHQNVHGLLESFCFNCNWPEENFGHQDSKLRFGLNSPNKVLDFEGTVLDSQRTSSDFFLKLNDTGIRPSLEVETMQKCASPLLELLPRGTTEQCNESPQNIVQFILKNISLEKEEELFSKSSMIHKKEFKQFEKEIWNTSKQFDDMRIPEPCFLPETLPDSVAEGLDFLELQPDEIEPSQSRLRWSFQPPDAESDLSILTNDIQIPQHKKPECFEKCLISDMDFDNRSYVQGSLEYVSTKSPSSEGNKEVTELDAVCQTTCLDLPLPNPLDSFMHVRSKVEHSYITETDKPRYTVAKVKQETGVIRPVTSFPEPETRSISHSKSIQVPISGLFEEVMQCLIDTSACHLNRVKQQGWIGQHQYFMDISTDEILFLIKEREKQSLDEGSLDIENDTKSLIILSILRETAELLLNASLETAILCLASQTDKDNAWLTGSIGEVHKQLFQYQLKSQQENIIHPKLTVLSHEIGTFSSQWPGCKSLILVQRGLNSLVLAVKQVLSYIPQLTIIVIADLKSQELESLPDTSLCVIAHHRSFTPEQLSHFSLVVLYDEKLDSSIRDTCKVIKTPCIGLVSQFLPVKQPQDKFKRSLPISVICSTEVTQHRQLLCILETRYNILVIERDYMKLRSRLEKLYYADFIISVTHCVVLIPFQEMRTQWDLESVMKRFVAMGLQFSYCYIIIHGIGTANRYLMDNETVSILYKLVAALCSLQGASAEFVVFYKIIVAINEEDVAFAVKNVVDLYVATSAETELLRPWLSADVSQDEEYLLQFTCLSTLSAQMLLRHLTVREIVEKSDKEITAFVPGIPDKVCKYLQYAAYTWRNELASQALALSSASSDKSAVSSSQNTRTSLICSLAVNEENNDIDNIYQVQPVLSNFNTSAQFSDVGFSAVQRPTQPQLKSTTNVSQNFPPISKVALQDDMLIKHIHQTNVSNGEKSLKESTLSEPHEDLSLMSTDENLTVEDWATKRMKVETCTGDTNFSNSCHFQEARSQENFTYGGQPEKPHSLYFSYAGMYNQSKGTEINMQSNQACRSGTSADSVLPFPDVFQVQEADENSECRFANSSTDQVLALKKRQNYEQFGTERNDNNLVFKLQNTNPSSHETDTCLFDATHSCRQNETVSQCRRGYVPTLFGHSEMEEYNHSLFGDCGSFIKSETTDWCEGASLNEKQHYEMDDVLHMPQNSELYLPKDSDPLYEVSHTGSEISQACSKFTCSVNYRNSAHRFQGNENFNTCVDGTSISPLHGALQGYGIFSSKASRDPNLLSDYAKDFCDTTTNLATEHCSESTAYKCDESSWNPVKRSKINFAATQSFDKPSLDFESVPFSVSRDLKKHMRNLEHCNHESLNVHKHGADGGRSNVRLSRPLPCQEKFYSGNEGNLDNVDDTCFDLNYMRDSETIGQRAQAFSTQTQQCQQRPIQFLQQHNDFLQITSTNDHSPSLRRCTSNKMRSTVNTFEKFPSLDGSDVLQDNCYSMKLDQSEHKNKNSYFQAHYVTESPCNHSKNFMLQDASLSSCGSDTKIYLETTCQNKDDYTMARLQASSNRIQSVTQSKLPYIPRHGVAIGLAQPLRRQSLSTATSNLDRSTSPPMDLPDDNRNSAGDRVATVSQMALQAKCKRWNSHLLHVNGLDAVSRSQGAGSSCDKSNSNNGSPRKRQLLLDKKPDNNSQTILVFK